ncbi:MAG: B12-binding domain-containing radical SAM protein [Promethearchaeota archaeon]|jgi:radical SAM superfamily enzyme YgiQ (UPF0313 family)
MINRILLIDIDIFKNEKSLDAIYYSHHPIGLLYLISAVRESFPEIDFNVFHTSTSNDPIKAVESLILSFNPDLVGLRSLSIAGEPFQLIAKKLRELRPDMPLVGGGPYPTTSYHDILSTGLVDIVVIGEGEETFIDLVGRLLKLPSIPADLKGTAVIEDGKVKVNEPRPLIQDVDSILFPDYDFINMKDYIGIENHALQDTSKSAFIFSSRGCPYGCFYCHQMFGKKIRRRSAENVVAEMREHIEKRGIFDFVFLDDIFNMPMSMGKKILSKIATDLPKVRINFPNGLRADHIDEKMLDLFESDGTVQIALAIETATPRLQKIIGKNLNLDKAKKAIQAASKRFIVRVFFIIGFPTETYEEAMATINYAKSFEYAAQPMLSVLRVYKNTKVFDLLNPNDEQVRAMEEQAKKAVLLEVFDKHSFYGDLFPSDKVPLKSNDIKDLFCKWMRNVFINSNRIKKSHEVLEKHLDQERILEFYRNIFDKPKFNEKALKKLLRP